MINTELKVGMVYEKVRPPERYKVEHVGEERIVVRNIRTNSTVAVLREKVELAFDEGRNRIVEEK